MRIKRHKVKKVYPRQVHRFCVGRELNFYNPNKYWAAAYKNYRDYKSGRKNFWSFLPNGNEADNWYAGYAPRTNGYHNPYQYRRYVDIKNGISMLGNALAKEVQEMISNYILTNQK